MTAFSGAQPEHNGDQQAVVDAVLGLHDARYFDGDGYGWKVCVECRQSWPCATVQAVDKVLGVERYANGNIKPQPASARSIADELTQEAEALGLYDEEADRG